MLHCTEACCHDTSWCSETNFRITISTLPGTCETCAGLFPFPFAGPFAGPFPGPFAGPLADASRFGEPTNAGGERELWVETLVGRCHFVQCQVFCVKKSKVIKLNLINSILKFSAGPKVVLFEQIYYKTNKSFSCNFSPKPSSLHFCFSFSLAWKQVFLRVKRR